MTAAHMGVTVACLMRKTGLLARCAAVVHAGGRARAAGWGVVFVCVCVCVEGLGEEPRDVERAARDDRMRIRCAAGAEGA